jgi:hypothetical protein
MRACYIKADSWDQADRMRQPDGLENDHRQYTTTNCNGVPHCLALQKSVLEKFIADPGG